MSETPTVKPKRAPAKPRAKKVNDLPKVKREPKVPPTKEETLKMLLDASNELKQIMTDLKQEELLIGPLGLIRIPELLKETLSNLEEDENEIKDKYDELMACDELDNFASESA